MIMTEEYQIEVYKQNNGSFPFIDWERKLPSKERAIVSARLARIRQGNFGDCKPLKGKESKGLYELRIHFGPGYRIYYGIIDKNIVLLLTGGDKKSQDRDIDKVKLFWSEYLDS